MNKIKLILGASILLLVSVQVNAAIIDTTGYWDGSRGLNHLGEPNSGTYGQTFSLGAANTLESFSFYLDNIYDNAEIIGYELYTGDVNFGAYVMEWDGNSASGNILFQSNRLSVSNTSIGYQEIAVNVGNLNLDIGEYVAFFSTSNYFDSIFDGALTGLSDIVSPGVKVDAYEGGTGAFLNNGSSFDSLTVTNWNLWQGDLAFTMTFSDEIVPYAPVPTPPVLFLFLTGLIGLIGFSKRRKAA